MARSSAACRWSTAWCCSSTPPRARCRRRGSSCARRSTAQLPVILVVNKVDRPDARIDEVVHEATDLLLGLASDLHEEVPDLDLDSILDVPVVYASAKAGRASLDAARRRRTAGQRGPRAALRDDPREDPGAVRTTRARRCRRTSPTSTPRRSSAASHCCGSTTAPCARVRPSRGPVTTAACRTSASPSCSRPRRSTACPRTRRAPATSSPSPASRTSRSARR